MTDFGDYEPEDVWDATDPADELVANLRRRLALLVDTADRTAPRAVLRGDDLATDIDYVLLTRNPPADLVRELILLARVLELVRE
jgi:hypothetical protein